MKLNVALNPGPACDGFCTVIKDGDVTVLEQSWRYGSNCSRDRKASGGDMPYAGDILQGLARSYHVDEFSVSGGKGALVVNRFVSRYCAGLLDTDGGAGRQEGCFLPGDAV